MEEYPRNTQTYARVSDNIQEYARVSKKNAQTYAKVSERVCKSIQENVDHTLDLEATACKTTKVRKSAISS